MNEKKTSTGKKGPGRPCKNPRFLIHNRTPFGEDFGLTREIFPGQVPCKPLSKGELDELHTSNRITTLKTLRMDPFGEFNDITFYMVPILFHEGDGTPEVVRENCRAWLADVVENLPADEAETLFKKILKLKKNLESTPHRICWLFQSYHEFITEFGFEPTKKRLREYACKKYPQAGFPAISNNLTQWDDELFLPAGLRDLEG